MAHFAVFAPPLKGHYGPYSHLASELIARGHDVTFIHHEEARALVEERRARFEATEGGSSLDSWTRPMGKIRGILGLGGTMKRMEEFTTMLCRQAPAIISRLGVDAIIADQLEPAGALVAERCGLPWITVASTIPLNREPTIPPPFVNWPYDPTLTGIRKNRSGWFISDLLLRSFNRCIERNARLLGVSEKRSMEDCFSGLLQIAQLVPALDFPRSEVPASLHYAGAFVGAEEGTFELPPDERPTVYCTLGTLQGSRTRLFQRIAFACSRAGVRLVLTHGGRADAGRLRQLPGGPLIYDWLPQRAVLKKVDLVICHGGIVTILDTIGSALPAIVMPLAFEQPGIAARVERSGAGLMLARRASSRAIASAIRQILENPAFRDRAKSIALEIRQAGGVTRAADLIEQALGAGARPGDATMARGAPGGARDGSRSGSR